MLLPMHKRCIERRATLGLPIDNTWCAAENRSRVVELHDSIQRAEVIQSHTF